MSLDQVDALDAPTTPEVPAESTSPIGRFNDIQAIFALSVALAATLAWTALLGWLMCRAVVVVLGLF